MVKKENIENTDVVIVSEVSENIADDNQFDLSVLKTDIEKAEKEAKEAIQQELINKANFQKESKILEVQAESIQDFEEEFKDFLEFIFSFLNKYFEKIDVSKLDSEFTSEFTTKLFALIPKEQLDNVKKFIGAGNKTNASKNIFKVMKFIYFISQEIYKRFDEYKLYKKTHNVGKKKGNQITEKIE